MPITKRYDDLGSINTVKLLPKIDSFNGYIQLFTELDSHIEEGDTIFITYSGETSNLNATDVILDNYINLIYSDDFIYDPFTQGYTVIYVNKNQNTFVINKTLESIPANKKLYGHFVSKVICNNINIEKSTINSTLFKNAEINTTNIDTNINWIQGIMLDGNIYNTTIQNKYDSNYISLLLEYYEDSNTYTKYSNINNNSYDYSYFYDLTSSVKNCLINGGIFYNCNITSDSQRIINNGYFENCLDITKYNIIDGYLKNSTLDKKSCVWYGGSWDGGTFNLKNWKNGQFLNGIFGEPTEEAIWESGSFYNGYWRGTEWTNGTFYGGIFEGQGYNENGEDINSIWRDGLFNGGIMYRSDYSIIAWEKGIVNGGKLIDVVFNSGNLKGGEIYNSHIKNSTINGAYVVGGEFSNTVTSGTSENYITNSTIYSGTITENTQVCDSIIYDGDFESAIFYNNNIFEDGSFKNSSFRNASVFNNGNYENCVFEKGRINLNKGTIRKKLLLNSGLKLVEKMLIDFTYDHIFDDNDAAGNIILYGFNSQELYEDENKFISIIDDDIYFDPTKYNPTLISTSGFSYMKGVGEKYLIIENDIYKEWMYGDTGLIFALTSDNDPGNMYFNNGEYRNSTFQGEGVIVNGGSYKNVIMKNNIVFNDGEFDGSNFYSETGQTENVWTNGKFYSGTFGKYVETETNTIVIDSDGSQIRTGATDYSGTTDFKIVEIYPLSLSDVEVTIETESPEALFTYSSPYLNINIIFTDNSTNEPTSWLWNINGDLSSEQNPIYRFTTLGDKVITLTVTNSVGSSTISETIVIIDNPIQLEADFKIKPTYSVINSVTTFLNLSTNGDSYEWDFGDGTPISTDVNPTHVYTTAELVTITLTATTGLLIDTKVMDYEIKFTDPNLAPLPDFEADYTNIFIGNSVQFRDKSQNATSWSWNFGDGGLSNDQNPEHTYTVAGKYDVRLLVSNLNYPLGDDIIKLGYIIVTKTYNPDLPDDTDILGDGPSAAAWESTTTNPLNSLYPDYNNPELVENNNLETIPFVDEQIAPNSEGSSPYDVVVKIECADTITTNKFLEYLDTVQKINFVDLTNPIDDEDDYENKYKTFKDLFKMDYSLIDYKVVSNYVFLIFRFDDLFNLYKNASDSEKDAYASNWRNLWSMANSGYYTHPYPTLSKNDITNVKTYEIYYWDGSNDRTKTSSDWIYGTTVPPWWISSNSINIDFGEAEGETAYKIKSPADEYYVNLLKYGQELDGSPTLASHNFETLRELNQNYGYGFHNFQSVDDQWYISSEFENWMKYHMKFRNNVGNTGDPVKYFINDNDVKEETIKLIVEDEFQLDVYGMSLNYAKTYYKAAYDELYTTCSIFGGLYPNPNGEIRGDWDTHLRTLGLGWWIDNFNASSEVGGNRIDSNRQHYNDYKLNTHNTWIFEKYHSFKKGDYNSFIESCSIDGGNYSEFAILYYQYYNNVERMPAFPSDLSFGLFTDDEKEDFKEVNSYISTDNTYFNFPCGIELVCENIDREYDDIWSGGTFYNGTFTAKWYGGNWSRGEWKGENYLNESVSKIIPTNISKDTSYKYVENYDSLKKRKLYYDIPPWDNANEQRSKIIKGKFKK